MLRAGRAGFTKKSLHLTFQSVQRGTIDGDAAPPISKLLKDNIEPRAKRFPATMGHRGENPRKRNNRKNKTTTTGGDGAVVGLRNARALFRMIHGLAQMTRQRYEATQQ